MDQIGRSSILRHFAEGANRDKQKRNFAITFLFPFIFAVLGAFTPDLHKDYGNNIIWIWMIVFAVFLLFSWKFSISEKSVVAVILENDVFEKDLAKTREQLDKMQSSINILAIQSEYSKSIRGAILEYTTKGNKDREITNVKELGEMVEELAAPLYMHGGTIFGFESSEKWNFAVYLYSPIQNLLIPVWRERSKSHPSSGIGREWGMGQGHIGKAFVDQKALITGDCREDGVSEFFSTPPGKDKPYDKQAYVSFASIPIGPILIVDKRPYGILVGTSDRPDRFDVEKAGILDHVAGAIAAALISCDLDIDTIRGMVKAPSGTGSDENGQATQTNGVAIDKEP